MTKALISIDQIEKSYRINGVNHSILKQVSLSIQSGELVAIVGPSGSGKSTLMNIIGLLDKSDEGGYFFNQQNINELSANDLALLRNQCIGFVFQQFNLLPRFTAFQNVALPLIYRPMSDALINNAVIQALTRVGMDTFINRRPSQLSGGQQQRIAIARALVGNPDVILADEPTGALDSRTGREVLNLFLSLHQEGRTLIIVTHDEHVAKQCPRQITIADGQIIDERYQ